MSAESDAYEDRAILDRLDRGQGDGRRPAVIGVVRPPGQAAVMRLAHRGAVIWSWGAGDDAGVMLVRRAATGAPPPCPGTPQTGGAGGGLRA